MGWWAEICPPGGVQNVHFGGSTGVSTVIILMSWWCLLLKDKPSGEHTDCLCMLEDINQVLLAVIKCHDFTLLAMFLALFFLLFAPSSRVTRVTLQEITKTSYNTRYPLGTNYYKERGISNYSAGVSLRLTPRFAHISSSNPSTARSSLEGPASGSSRRSSTYSRTGSMAAIVNSLRVWIRRCMHWGQRGSYLAGTL